MPSVFRKALTVPNEKYLHLGSGQRDIISSVQQDVAKIRIQASRFRLEF
jgi:hypothetical protein